MSGKYIVDTESTESAKNTVDSADDSITDKKGKNKSLVVFFVLLLACAITGLDIIQVVLVSRRIKISTEKSFKESCEQVTAGYSHSLANKVGEYAGRLDRYMTEDIVTSGDETQIVQWLRFHAGIRDKDFNAVFFCGADGISCDDSGMTTDIAGRDVFTAIMQQNRDTYVSNPDMFNGEAVTTIVRAVKHDGITIGFFGCVIPLKTIQDIVGSIKLGNGGYAILLSDDGTIMSYPETAVVMKKNLLRDSESRADIEALAAKMTAGESGIMWTSDYAAAENKNLVAYDPVRGTPWSLAFSVPETQVYASRNELVRWMVITVCVIGVILISYCNFFIRAEGLIPRPLGRMKGIKSRLRYL
jgi:methyl-accepting chemotaxis protein